MAPKWVRCRDTYAGNDAVKAKGTDYLPELDSHATDKEKYQSYKDRALFYNAMARTVDGMSGGIFQKAPVIRAEDAVLAHLQDVTLTDESAQLFALHAAREVLITGRRGILVDMAEQPTSASARPYWVGYRAEDAIAHRASAIDGDEILTRVVLREVLLEPDAKDEFALVEIEQYRVLELNFTDVGRIYTQQRWRKAGDNEEFAPFGDAIIPTRKAQPLNFIPFVFANPGSVSPSIVKPPLLDLVDVNLSHYRTMADLEHGRHFTALPTAWVSGHKQEEKLQLGSSVALVMPSENAKMGMLEFTGQGLGALDHADQQKRHMMSVLGARMLEEQPQTSQTETAFAVNMRHAGEQATLRTLAQSLETALTLALQWHSWWIGTEATPKETGAMFELNKDFASVRMTPEELRAQVEALNTGAIPFEDFYFNYARGDLARPGVTPEQARGELQPPATDAPVNEE
jgi:hypothetical protein